MVFPIADNFVTTLQIIATALVTMMGSWFVYRGKLKEYENALKIVERQEESEVILAQRDLQIEFAKAAENMISPLNRRIQEQEELIQKFRVEIEQLRDYVRHQDEQIEEVKKENQMLKSQVFVLESDNLKKSDMIKDLEEKISRIKGELDTGPLDSKGRK